MSEAELIQENKKFLYKCAWDFCKERQLSPALYFKDVFQEAAIAYIKRTRYMNTHPDAEECMPTVIKRYLGRRFLDLHGVHINHHFKWTHAEIWAAKEIEKEMSQMAPAPGEDDSVFLLDFERWRRTLNTQDAAILAMILDEVPYAEIARRMNMHINTCSYRRKVIQRSFMEYFKEAG